MNFSPRYDVISGKVVLLQSTEASACGVDKGISSPLSGQIAASATRKLIAANTIRVLPKVRPISS